MTSEQRQSSNTEKKIYSTQQKFVIFVSICLFQLYVWGKPGGVKYDSKPITTAQIYRNVVWYVSFKTQRVFYDKAVKFLFRKIIKASNVWAFFTRRIRTKREIKREKIETPSGQAHQRQAAKIKKGLGQNDFILLCNHLWPPFDLFSQKEEWVSDICLWLSLKTEA